MCGGVGTYAIYSYTPKSTVLTPVAVTRVKVAGGPEGQCKIVAKQRFGNQTDGATYPSASISLLSASVPQFTLLYNMDNTNANLSVACDWSLALQLSGPQERIE